MTLAERDALDLREYLIRARPDCPECGSERVRLSRVDPIEWRCRECKTGWIES